MNSSVVRRHLLPNLFDPRTYYKVDIRLGVMRNRFGTKCCTLSGHLLTGLHRGLLEECGPAWSLVLRRCGEIWGKRFAARFVEEISKFYSEGLDAMPAARFHALLEEHFAVSGWGRLVADWSRADAGILQFELHNAVFGSVLPGNERKDQLLEGVLRAVFSQVSGQDLDCYETECIGLGAPTCRFVLGLTSRLSGVPEMLEAGLSHDEVVKKLLAVSTAG